MDSIKAKGIVTRSIDWHENDKLVTLVTLEYGKMTATVRGCKKPNARLRYAAEPLNFGDYLLAGKDGRYVVAECSQIDSFTPVTADIDKYYAASLVLDLLARLTKDEPSPELLAAALKTLSNMCYSDESANAAVAEFLKACLELNGCGLDTRNCSACGCTLEEKAFFSTSEGLVCEHCANTFTDVAVDKCIRDCLNGVESTSAVEKRANRFLAYAIETMLGVKTNKIYFGDIE